jgi:hypothetical protein
MHKRSTHDRCQKWPKTCSVRIETHAVANHQLECSVLRLALALMTTGAGDWEHETNDEYEADIRMITAMDAATMDR